MECRKGFDISGLDSVSPGMCDHALPISIFDHLTFVHAYITKLTVVDDGFMVKARSVNYFFIRL